MKSVILIAWALMVLVTQTRMTPSGGGIRVEVVEVYEQRERFLNREFCELNARRLQSEGKSAYCAEIP